MRTILTANELECTLNMITFLFPKNSRRKNAFLAVCYSIDKEVNLHFVNEMAEFGGLIGPGNSFLDRYFTYFKLFRLHAIFRDAFGFMKSNYNVGPGYVYALSEKPIFANSMFLGHITGLAYWFHMKVYKSSDYKKYCL